MTFRLFRSTGFFNFQLQDFGKKFSSHSAHCKAVDGDNPLPPTQKPRGYGRVAIFYRKSLNATGKKLSVGGTRTVAIEVLTSPPLCFCSVYMPSKNSRGDSMDAEEYLHLLDRLEEIQNTYSSTHVIFILVDINASLCKRKGHNQDALLKEFVQSNALVCRQESADTQWTHNVKMTSYQR